MRAALIGIASAVLLVVPTHAQSLNEGTKIQNSPRTQIEIRSWGEEFGPAVRGEPTTTGSIASTPAIGLTASQQECEVIEVRSPQAPGETVIRKFYKCGR